MRKLRKALSALLLFCLTLGITGYLVPVEAHAASSWSNENGTISVANLDGDFKDGKYRFNVQITYDKTYCKGDSKYDVDITNVHLVNSSGKTVATWKDRGGLLINGGTTVQRFSIDFSGYPSDTYTLWYTVYAIDWMGYQHREYKSTVTHSAGNIQYASSKYVYDTNGQKKLEAKFRIKQLKGYVPKVQIYNSDGKLIRTFPKGGKISSNDTIYTATWAMCNDEGVQIKPGTYTMKITVNGKSGSRKFKLDPN